MLLRKMHPEILNFGSFSAFVENSQNFELQRSIMNWMATFERNLSFPCLKDILDEILLNFAGKLEELVTLFPLIQSFP